jgi:hypothetical protein
MNDKQKRDPVETFDWTEFDSPSTAVVTAVAEEAGVDPITIDPLYEVVDPDALDTIVASRSYLHGSPNASTEFTYHGYRVLIKANGRGYLYDVNHSSTAEPHQVDISKQAD